MALFGSKKNTEKKAAPKKVAKAVSAPKEMKAAVVVAGGKDVLMRPRIT